MTDFDPRNTFIMFVNNRKGSNEKAPDRVGTLNVNGVEYEISGWVKQGKKGQFLAGKIKLKTEGARGG